MRHVLPGAMDAGLLFASECLLVVVGMLAGPSCRVLLRCHVLLSAAHVVWVIVHGMQHARPTCLYREQRVHTLL